MNSNISTRKSDKKKTLSSLLLMTIGLLLIVAALFLVLYNTWDAERARKASDATVEKLEEIISDEKTDILNDNDPSKQMSSIEIDGYSYIGIIEIPSLNLKLPVMETWDYERLKISACRYSGSCYSEDLVICAHNYAKHFAAIKRMDLGADVYFVTVDGSVYHYQVSNRETIRPTAVEEMINKTEEDWDMTLFTCNTGGQTRCAVRCIQVK